MSSRRARASSPPRISAAACKSLTVVWLIFPAQFFRMSEPRSSRGFPRQGIGIKPLAVLSFDLEPRVGYLYVALTGELERGGAEAKFSEMLAAAAGLRHA